MFNLISSQSQRLLTEKKRFLLARAMSMNSFRLSLSFYLASSSESFANLFAVAPRKISLGKFSRRKCLGKIQELKNCEKFHFTEATLCQRKCSQRHLSRRVASKRFEAEDAAEKSQIGLSFRAIDVSLRDCHPRVRRAAKGRSSSRYTRRLRTDLSGKRGLRRHGWKKHG